MVETLQELVDPSLIPYPIPESPQPPICLLDSAWFLLGTEC